MGGVGELTMRVASTDGMESTIMEKDEQNCVWKAPWRRMDEQNCVFPHPHTFNGLLARLYFSSIRHI